jgi:2,3-dihydroxyphenylpropionate 1,2-dioxygenase
VIFERLAAGNLRYLLSFDSVALDRTGNVECRSLQILAGMIGDRKPDSALFEPSWHHIYAVIGWTDLAPVKPEPLYYPATAPERSELARAIFAIVDDAASRAAFSADRDGYAARFALDADERRALVSLDRDALRERFRINPMLLYQLEARAKP